MYKAILVGVMSIFFANSALASHDGSFRTLFNEGNSAIYIFTDPETKCEYLTYFLNRTRSPSMTPRIGEDGKPMCNVPHMVLDPESESFEIIQDEYYTR